MPSGSSWCLCLGPACSWWSIRMCCTGGNQRKQSRLVAFLEPVMNEITKWEYRVENLGSVLKSPNDDEIEATLNDWGSEGWEMISVIQHSSTNKVRIVA